MIGFLINPNQFSRITKKITWHYIYFVSSISDIIHIAKKLQNDT